MVACNICKKEFEVPILKRIFGNVQHCPACTLIIQEKERIQKEEDNRRKSAIEQYENKLDNIVSFGTISEENESELHEFMLSLRITESDIEHTKSKLQRIKKLTLLRSGELPTIEVYGEMILKKNELCHYSAGSNLIEERSKTRYVGGSQGVSVRIAKGLYYRVGQFKGERVVDTFKQVTDSGTLFITNQRVCFVGRTKSITYPINKIISFNIYSDAVQIIKENDSKPKYFSINSTDYLDEIGVVLSRIVNQ